MKKTTKKNSIIAVIILAVFTLLYINSCTTFNFKNLQRQSPLPNQYKSYRTLDSLVSDSVFKVFPGHHKITYYDSLNNNIICENNFKSDTTIYYKMNADGLITDSIQLFGKTAYESHYLLQNNYYYDWVLTGDTTKHPYITIDNNGIKTPEILDNTVKKNFNQAAATHIYHGDYTYNNGKEQESNDDFLFLINKKWQSLSVNKKLNKYTSFNSEYEKYNDNNVKSFYIVDDSLALPYGLTVDDFKKDNSIPNVPFYVAYFDKKEYIAERSSQKIGSPTGGSHQDALWRGIAYINYKYGKDTLKFKYKYLIQMDKTNWASWTKYDHSPEIYVNPRLNFIVVDGYIIKQRKK